MLYAGIDIGSTASKAVVMNDGKDEILARKLMPSGWNGRETAETLLAWLLSLGCAREELRITATGYGRVSVPYADDTLTEITLTRSEERRVGKECRSRWSPYH